MELYPNNPLAFWSTSGSAYLSFSQNCRSPQYNTILDFKYNRRSGSMSRLGTLPKTITMTLVALPCLRA